MFRVFCFFTLLISFATPCPAVENIDRGIVARPMADGKIYVGWRLLDSDAKDVAFNVYRRSGEAKPVKLNESPIAKTTDFIDATVPKEGEHAWFVRPVSGGKEAESSREATAAASEKPSPYISLKLNGDHTFQKVGIADLNNDQWLDLVVGNPAGEFHYYPGHQSVLLQGVRI